MKQVAGDLAGEAVVAMINVDDNPGAARELGVRGIPAMVIVKDGEAVGRVRGRDHAAILRGVRDAL